MMRGFFVIAAVAALMMGACKPSEDNYRKSYEAAVVKQRGQQAANDSVEATIHNRIMEKTKPHPVTVAGKEILVMEDNVWQAFNADSRKMKKYSVVVGAMRQQFNAKAFCSRLEGLGCPAYVIVDRQKNYFVTAAGFDSLEEAAGYIADIDRQLPVKLPIEEPFVYITTRL